MTTIIFLDVQKYHAGCWGISFPALKSERVSSLAGKKVFEFVFSKAAG
jgi:hypothetical protein